MRNLQTGPSYTSILLSQSCEKVARVEAAEVLELLPDEEGRLEQIDDLVMQNLANGANVWQIFARFRLYRHQILQIDLYFAVFN